MERQFAGFSQSFNPETFGRTGFEGLVIASPDTFAAYYYTELGFETGFQDDAPPSIREVFPREGLNYATSEDVDRAAANAGHSVFMSETDQKETLPNSAFSPEMRNFDSEANHYLLDPKVRSALEEAGFFGYKGYVTVGIDVIDATILWDADSFTLSDPVPLIVSNENFPYVEIDFSAMTAKKI
jgi:hypothetical protein